MATRGFLIRFIDIGLIVLFGFLMISDIERSSRIELDLSTEQAERPSTVPDERRFFAVEIAADGVFKVADAQSGAVFADGLSMLSELSRELQRLDDLHRGDDVDLVVLITPHEDSPIQYTVDVMDLCDRLSLTKSLHVDIVAAASPVP